jgi:hypothetical protein
MYNWVAGNGWMSLITVSGAMDTELAWSTPATATAYFNSLAAAETNAQIYDYGDAAGCPTQGFATCCPIPNTACQNPWGQGDVYNLAWGATAGYALPEIYTTSGSQAQQWFYLSEWGVQNQAGKYIWFSGSLTHYRACQQVGCPTGTNNLPADGWNQLDWWINTDSRTAMTPPYSSDIRYLPPG